MDRISGKTGFSFINVSFIKSLLSNCSLQADVKCATDIKKCRTTTAKGNCVAKNGQTRKVHTMFWKNCVMSRDLVIFTAKHLNEYCL